MKTHVISYKNPWAYLSVPREPRSASSANAHFTREPSICRSVRGLVLHSANLRSTVFIAASKDADQAEKAFKAATSTRARSRVVDSYFS